MNFALSHLFPVLDEAVDGDIVDDVPGADDQRVAVLPQQLEVVRVRVVPEEAVGHTWRGQGGDGERSINLVTL